MIIKFGRISQTANFIEMRSRMEIWKLHLIYKKRGDGQAETYKTRILTDYPNSEIAAIIKDPGYLKKKEELEVKELLTKQSW